jgi:hypothetical protein
MKDYNNHLPTKRGQEGGHGFRALGQRAQAVGTLTLLLALDWRSRNQTEKRGTTTNKLAKTRGNVIPEANEGNTQRRTRQC